MTSLAFDDLQLSRSLLLEEVGDETPLDVWLEKRREHFYTETDEEESDDEGENYDLRRRANRIAALSESDLARFRTHEDESPSFNATHYHSGRERKLAFVKESPKWGPLLYFFGGWNDIPAPAVIGQMIERWHERYGAELAYLGEDTLELLVEKPLTLDQVKVAALEIPLFCSETLNYRNDVAIACNPVWSFWWD